MKNKMLIIKIVTVVLVFMNIIILFERIILPKFKSSPKAQDDTYVQDLEEKYIQNGQLPPTSELSEKDRLRLYLATYIRSLEERNYEKAYGYLYDNFKQNYFKTIDEYKHYIENKNFPDIIAIEYNDISRQGEYYILDVTLSDAMDDDGFKEYILFVIKENAADDFDLSFEI